MRRIATAAFLVLLFLSTSTLAQDLSPSTVSADAAIQSGDSTVAGPVRNPAAVALLEKALAALGGEAMASQVTDSVTAGVLDPAPNSKSQSRTFVWKVAGEEFRREVQDSSGLAVFVSGHGKAESTRPGKSRRIFHHVVQASPPLSHQPSVRDGQGSIARAPVHARYAQWPILPRAVSRGGDQVNVELCDGEYCRIEGNTCF
jgi:hypothetical protein